jgi:hypothetical protein
MTTEKKQNSDYRIFSKTSVIRIGVMLFIIAILVMTSYSQSGNLLLKFWGGEKRTKISTEELLAEYGFEVRLIGVTAAGGLIDVRFKIRDKAKAAILLKDIDRFPELVAENGVVLKVPAEGVDEMPLEDNGIVFMLFPNLGGAVIPDSLVKIRFGNLELEPILAQ